MANQKLKRAEPNIIPYIKFSLSLSGCVTNETLDSFITDLKNHLMDTLKPDFSSDIEIEIEESAGLKEGLKNG